MRIRARVSVRVSVVRVRIGVRVSPSRLTSQWPRESFMPPSRSVSWSHLVRVRVRAWASVWLALGLG